MSAFAKIIDVVSKQYRINSMDFVPSPSNVLVPLEDHPSFIGVPYVVTFAYNLKGFERFCNRSGFVKDSQLNLKT